jgi:hypothetical protein
VADRGSGLDFVKQLVGCGIAESSVAVVPRTPDVWMGIGEVRKRLPRMWFHPRCDAEIVSGDTRLPGGVARLEGYRRAKNSGTGQLRAMPLKDDVCDHVADALRYFCEADAASMVGARSFSPKPERVVLYDGTLSGVPEETAVLYGHGNQ